MHKANFKFITLFLLLLLLLLQKIIKKLKILKYLRLQDIIQKSNKFLKLMNFFSEKFS